MKQLLAVVWMLPLLAFAQERSYLEVKARSGDGVYSLLRQYRVNTPCNLSLFYKLNKLTSKSGLKLNKTYKLPIYVYEYDEKSIRTTIGVQDRPLAERIQAYNEYMLKAGYMVGDYRIELDLWVPSNYLSCPTEKLDLSGPTAIVEIGGEESTTTAKPGLRGTYDIFGEKHKNVYLQGNELAGCVFYIVSGHGGPDPGAVGKYYSKSLCEDEYAYDVALRLAKGLLEHGATAYVVIRDPDDGIRSGEILACDKDEVCWGNKAIPIGQKARLGQRAETVNKLYLKNKKNGVTYQRMVVIHVDSEARNERVDMFFYHRLSDPTSKVFATTLQQMIKEKYEVYRKGRGYDGTVSVRDLWMLRETLMPTAFIELGNIRNRNDQARLVIEGNRQLVANWLLEGILRDKKKYR